MIGRFMIRLIRGYQRYISPGLGARCRFLPTCSEYAAEAIARHGAFFGTVLATWRILRCNPFGSGGFDPVPEKKNMKTTRLGGNGTAQAVE